MNELNKRMFAIENLLSRLEEKMGPADEVRTPITSPTNKPRSSLDQVKAQKVFHILCVYAEPIGPK